MYNKLFIIFTICLTLLFSNIMQVNAININKNVEGYRYVLDDGCEDSDSALGNVNDPDSVAWLLQQVLDFIKVVGPLLVVVLSSIEFLKVVGTGNEDAMKKATTRLWQRLVLVALLFFLPIIVSALLEVFGFTSTTTCGLT